MAFKEEGSVNYTIINGKKVPVVKCETEVVLRNTQTNYEYGSDKEAEDDIADPNSPTQREFITRSLKIKVAAMPPLGAASDEDKEEQLLELLIEKGISEVKPLQDVGIELIGDADAYTDIKETLVSSGYTIEFSEVVMLAKVPISVSAEDLVNIEKLKSVLESLDDVQNVFTNADI